tara:strand:+ start:470 stop:670 length:201 start_codon:yes stop_codon:yes gene_type:complete
MIAETSSLCIILGVFICWMCKSRESGNTVTTPKPVAVTNIENVLEVLEEADTYEPPEPPAYVDVTK